METRQRTKSLRWGLRIGRVATALVALLLATSVALANVPTTGTFVGKDNARGQFVVFQRPGENFLYRDWAGVLRLQLDQNTKGDRQGPLANVFCIQLFVPVSAGNTYFSNGTVTALQGGCYIRYLLAHYPAASVTSTAEGAARQLAIWRFSDNLDLNTIQDAAIRARAQTLAAEAQTQVDTNGCPGTNAGLATLTLTPANATVPQGQPVPYTVQLSPANAATSVNITVDGTALLDNGTQAATLSLNQGVASFTVTNPNPGTVNVSAVVPYVMDEGTVFDSDRTPPTQRLVLGDGASLTASAQVQTIFQQVTPTNTPLPTDTPVPTNTPLPTNTPGGPTDTPVPTNTPATSTPGGGPEITPTSTRTASKTPKPTEPPGGGDSPTSTPASGDGATPTPPPAAGVTPDAGVQPTPDGGLTSSNLARARPRSLPNTAAPADRTSEWLLLLAAALLLAGIALQRRGARR